MLRNPIPHETTARRLLTKHNNGNADVDHVAVDVAIAAVVEALQWRDQVIQQRDRAQSDASRLRYPDTMGQ